MPRLARKYIESSFLHIIVQGINKEYVFKNKELKDLYKNILKKNLSNTNVTTLAYCIMDNHVHLLLYSDNVSAITKLMQKTNTSYAKAYNKINKRVGYVFRDRYFVQMITSEIQLLNCLVYIHNNPINANIVNKRELYKYSSYIEYTGLIKDFITEEAINLIFGSQKNFKDTFNLIHENKNIEDIAEIQEDFLTSEQVICSYLKKYNCDIDSIIYNEDAFNKLLLDLRHLCGISLREMSQIFNVNKDKLNKIINKNL